MIELFPLLYYISYGCNKANFPHENTSQVYEEYNSENFREHRIKNKKLLIKEFGVDIVRLWVLSSDYKSDVSISKNIMKQVSEVYRKIRNTARYILGNISDFDIIKLVRRVYE